MADTVPAVAGMVARVVGGRLMLVKADPAASGPPVAAPAATDAAGKPIETGAAVALPDGGMATVTADQGDGTIRVQREDTGDEVVIDASTVTVVRSATQNAQQDGPDALSQALADTPDATPAPGDRAAAQAQTDPAASADNPVGGSPAPDADPAGAAAYLANPNGPEVAWLRTDEGDLPVGYFRSDGNDPTTTLRFTDTDAWTQAADGAGVEETDQVPPGPGAPTDSSSTPSTPSAAGNPEAGPGTAPAAGDASSPPGDPAAGAAGSPAQPDAAFPAGPEGLPAAASAPTRLALDADVAAPDQVFAFLNTGLAWTGNGAGAVRSARAQLTDNLTGRLTAVPDEVMIIGADAARLNRIESGDTVLLRIPRPDYTPADPANPTVGDQLNGWLFTEAVAGTFRELVASGQTPPEGLEVVTVAQWRAWCRAARVARAVSRWALTAGGSDPETLALQDAAEALFAMDGVAPWPGYDGRPELRDAVEDAKRRHGAFHRALLLAMYTATQEALRSAQIKAVRLARGWQSYDGIPEWAVTESTEELPLRPLSSFTAEEHAAGAYARGKGADSGWVTTATVPAERILSCPRTGFGSLPVAEFVVLAGPGPWAVREAIEQTDGPTRSAAWNPDAHPAAPAPVDVDTDPFDPVATPAALIASEDQLSAALANAPDDDRRRELIGRAATMGLSTLVPASWAGDGSINPVDDSDQRGPDGALIPLGRDEIAARVQAVTAAIGKAAAGGLASDRVFTVHGDGQVWTDERAAAHAEIVDAVWATATSVADEGRALLLGGLDPAGILAALDQPRAGLEQADYLTVTLPDIVAILAARGLIPVVPDAGVPLAPLERSPLVHVEACHIAELLVTRAAAERKNLALELTMGDEGILEQRIGRLREGGYAEIRGLFADTPIEAAAAAATARYIAGVEAYRNGVGFGGRYVPVAVIRALAGQEFGSAPRAAFEAVRDSFDDWQVWDTGTGDEPRLVYYKDAPDLPRLTELARSGRTLATLAKRLPGTRAALAAVLRGGPR